jgi:hypothetical protein
MMVFSEISHMFIRALIFCTDYLLSGMCPYVNVSRVGRLFPGFSALEFVQNDWGCGPNWDPGGVSVVWGYYKSAGGFNPPLMLGLEKSLVVGAWY